MIITKNIFKISNIIVSTVLGIAGNGILPLKIISSAYRKFISTVRESGTTVIGKSFTHQKRIGNFISWKPWTWKYIQTVEEDGMLNAYGLTNKGTREVWKIKRSAEKGIEIIPNYFPDFSKGEIEAFRQTKRATFMLSNLLDLHDNFHALELNSSCPNTKDGIRNNVKKVIYLCREMARKFPDLTLIVKISYVHPYELAEELEKVGVDIIHSINTIPFNILYPNKISPLAKVGGGGVSGGPARNLSLKYNRELRKRIKIPIIMGCGVTSLDDVERFEDIGADSVSMCTVVRRNPEEAIRIIRIKNMGGER